MPEGLKALPATARRRPALARSAALHAEFDEDSRTVWLSLAPDENGYLGAEHARDLLGQLSAVLAEADTVDAVVLSSASPRVFGLGTDYARLERLARQGGRRVLRACADGWIRVIHRIVHDLAPVALTVSAIRGDALGTSLELALASQVVVAERGVRMGFPEIDANRFPGFGAYSLLSRKCGPRVAEDFIVSGRLMVAEDLHALGVVDQLADPGALEPVVRRLVAQRRRNLGGYLAYQQAKRASLQELPMRELRASAKVWVDWIEATAMNGGRLASAALRAVR